MNFDITDEQRMLVDSVRQFTTRDSRIERARRLRDDPVGYEVDVWRQMGELGWLAAAFPASAGGLDGGFVDLALILEEFGKTLVPEPFVPSVVLAGAALLTGDAGQQERFLQPMLEGRTSLAFAHTEQTNRFGGLPVEVTATRDGGGYRVRGRKVWVDNGHRAEQLVVSALVDGGPTLLVVDRSEATVEPLQTIDGRRSATVTLDTVVQADRVLGEPGGAAPTLARLLDRGAAAAVAEGLGACQTMLDLTVGHLKGRVQFGVPIGSFQALQHRAVDMFTEVELLRSAAMASTVLADSPDVDERTRAVSAAKFQLCTGGAFVSREAIQLHGGIGVTDEHDIGLFFKRMQVLCTRFGDEEHHVGRVAALGR